MMLFTYNGCNDDRKGEACSIVGVFRSTHQSSLMRSYEGESIGKNTKYCVAFKNDCETIHVMGYNLQCLIGTNSEHDGRIHTPYIRVKFLETNKHYLYRNVDLKLRVGDMVVVEVHSTVKVAKVMSLSYNVEINADKYVVQRIDFEAVKESREKANKIAALQSKIDTRVELLRNEIALTKLVKEDQELAFLVDRLNSLK